MARNRYLTMTASDQLNTQGLQYPDVISNPITDFDIIDIEEQHVVRRQDIMRIDLLMYEKYQAAQYDDTVLNLNSIGSVHLLDPGDVILLPSKRDLDNYYSKHLKDNF